jgi:acylpyruvate hydrolase
LAWPVAGGAGISGHAGVGAARKPPVFMQPGDVFEVEIEGLGVLTNQVEQN